MVEQIRIRNYQSLESVDIKLGNITVITGKTDSGKTAFFRAMRGMVRNQTGNDFITHGKTKTAVAMDNIAWIQSKTDNTYQIGTRKWEKCGRSVPEDVTEELGMGEFVFGKDVKYLLNFSGQLDPAFIVQGNPADNAKIIGSISNIHVIYNALREAEKDTKATKRQITTISEQAEHYKEQLEATEPELDRLEILHAKMKDIFDRAKKLDAKISNIASLKARIATLPDERELISRIKILSKVNFRDYIGRIDLIEKCQVLTERHRLVETELKATEGDQSLFKGISTEKGHVLLEKLKVLSELKSQLRDVSERSDNVKGQMASIQIGIDDLKEEMGEIDVCELCGADRKDWNL